MAVATGAAAVAHGTRNAQMHTLTQMHTCPHAHMHTRTQATFYSECAPRLAALAAGLGYDPSGPSPSSQTSGGSGGSSANGSGSSGSSSWCWCPEPVVVEAEPPNHFLFVLSDLRGAFPNQPHAYDLEVRAPAVGSGLPAGVRAWKGVRRVGLCIGSQTARAPISPTRQAHP
jgi:hypothetical protein